MTAPLRIGFIGAGENTRVRHIPGLKQQADVELLGVVNRSRESSERVSKEFAIPRVYDRWEDLMADPDVDAVCIGTWPYMHAPLTIAALTAGKHVLCEARMAMNAREAHAMLEASRKRPDLTAQIVPSPFMLGPDAAIYDTLHGGLLGDLLAADFQLNTGAFIDPEAPLTWRQDARLSGLNAMAMGIIYETMMRWIGPAQTVCAMTRINVPRRRDASGNEVTITIPDHVEVLCELASGGLGHLRFSAVTGQSPDNAAWLYGTDGTLRADFKQQRVFFAARGDDTFADITPPKETWNGWRVEEEFINAIRGREQIKSTTFEDGVRYMEFTEAVALSQRDGRRINLPLTEFLGDD